MSRRYYSMNYFYIGAVMLLLGVFGSFQKPIDEIAVPHARAVLFLLVLGGFLVYITLKSYWSIIKCFTFLWLLLFVIQLSYNTELTKFFHGQPEQYNIIGQMFENIWQHRTSMDSEKLIDNIQQKFRCCGFNGPHDYLKDNFPLSCCISYVCDYPSNVFSKGCYDVFHENVPVFLRA